MYPTEEQQETARAYLARGNKTVYKINDPSVNIQSLLDYANDDSIALVLVGGSTTVFIRQEFLNRFSTYDNVRVANAALTKSWGGKNCETAQDSKLSLCVRHNYNATPLTDWRYLFTDHSVADIFASLREAKEYRRQLEFTTYEMRG